MDVVYICREGDNEELRYSIRSVIKNMPHDNIWVVGGKPNWYKGNYVEVRQYRSKLINARSNMEAIANSDEISDDFILMNDDFFIMQPIDSVEYYYSGPLMNKIEYFMNKHPSSTYTKLLKQSFKVLRRHGVGYPLDYSLHVPMVMNKQKLKRILQLNISWRLAYGNIYSVGGILVEDPGSQTKDVKIYIENDKLISVDSNPLSKNYLSTEDKAFQKMKSFFQARFPVPSPYEKWARG